jgi:hypothetical protein
MFEHAPELAGYCRISLLPMTDPMHLLNPTTRYLQVFGGVPLGDKRGFWLFAPSPRAHFFRLQRIRARIHLFLGLALPTQKQANPGLRAGRSHRRTRSWASKKCGSFGRTEALPPPATQFYSDLFCGGFRVLDHRPQTPTATPRYRHSKVLRPPRRYCLLFEDTMGRSADSR